MGFWKSVKKAVGDIGDVGKRLAPGLAFIPGVGPVAAGAVGGLSALAGNLNDDDGFKGALGDTMAGAGAGYLGAKGIGAMRNPGGFGAGIKAAVGGKGMGGALDFFTDEKQGLARTNLLMSGIGAGASAYGARQAGAVEDRRMDRDDEDRDYLRQRQRQTDPARDRILNSILNRLDAQG